MKSLTDCRACKSGRLYTFLRLGAHPAANAFLPPDRVGTELKYPLDARVCLDCGLIQVPDPLPPDFFRHYVYVPSASETMHRHFDAFAAVATGALLGSGMIVDIGCNDGLFLKACKDRGARTLGIEPAANIGELARAKGLEVIGDYFGPATARVVKAGHGQARVIVCTNTFNHIDDLRAFMEGVEILLEPAGTFIIEVPHSLDLVEKNEFDTIYHEHLSEFSVKSIVDLCACFGMSVVDVQRLVIHGGSMRVFVRRTAIPGQTPSLAVAEWLRRERDAGLFSAGTYDQLAARVDRIRSELVSMLRRLKAAGRRLAGYGAPAKGTTLLNYFKIGPDLLDYLADKNPLKQGLLCPGVHIPVVAPARIEETKPDYLLILAWNFADEIMEQQESHRRRGGKFILPIPEPRIVD